MKIVILEPLGIDATSMNEQLEKLKSQHHTIQLYAERTENPIELISRCSDADVVILSNIPFPKEVIVECKNLKLISVAFTGVDHIDVEECKAHNIVVSNAAGYSTFSVAELVIGLTLSVLRKIPACDSATRVKSTRQYLIGQELYGKTFGIIGTGAIGSNIAKLALAFGCHVVAYSRSEKNDLKTLGVEYLSLEDLLTRSDIISLHVPLSKSTKHLLNYNNLTLVKPTAIVVNCARGPVIDNVALASLLKSHKIAGAGIDVFDSEPPLESDNPLLTAPNTILTPHIAFATKEAFLRRFEIVISNIEYWLNGQPKNQIC